MLDKIKAADFSKLINKEFRIYFEPSDPSNAELIELNKHNVPSESERRTPFSIVFRGPVDKVWPQGMYKIEHKSMGELELFLVPIGPDDKGICYEAVFN
jgi:hypothetical protein